MQIHPVSDSTDSTRKPPPLRCSECNRSCGRLRELQRHISSAHLPRWLHCPHFPCPWRGHRKEDFKTHLREHPGSDPNVGPCLVYEIDLVLDWIKEGTPVETAATYALDFVSERALVLGFVEEWKNLWGGRRKKAQHRRGRSARQ